MKTYLITDTHFFHDKMIDFCGRPENFTELIGKNLLDLQVEENDVLLHLGDICIGRDEEAHELYIKPLKCKKWLVRGNHDDKSNNWYLSHGWDWVGFKFQDRFFGKNIMFSHTPIRYISEQSGLWGSDSYDINIHGHFHNTAHHTREIWVEKIKNDKQKLLAIEYTDYKPVLLEDFI